MGFKFMHAAAFVLLFVALATEVKAADPELLVDFMPPMGMMQKDVNGTFFTSTELRNVPLTSTQFATVKPTNFTNFPALNGLGVSVASLTFPPYTVNRPHTHPRGTEVLFIIEGVLSVGLVDSQGNLFVNTLYPGDLFVFPRGLVHFQINRDPKITVKAVASFSSAGPGTITLPPTLFGTGIDVDVLVKSFEVSDDVINQLVAAQK